MCSDGNTSVKVCGIQFKRDAATNSYKCQFDEKDCKIKGELHFNGNGVEGVKFADDGRICFNAEKTDFCRCVS